MLLTHLDNGSLNVLRKAPLRFPAPAARETVLGRQVAHGPVACRCRHLLHERVPGWCFVDSPLPSDPRNQRRPPPGYLTVGKGPRRSRHSGAARTVTSRAQKAYGYPMLPKRYHWVD